MSRAKRCDGDDDDVMMAHAREISLLVATDHHALFVHLLQPATAAVAVLYVCFVIYRARSSTDRRLPAAARCF